MKVLYISSTHAGMHESSIYYDLMQEFVANGHEVTIAYAREKRLNLKTELYTQNNMRYLGIRTGNISKNKNLIEKGISLLSIDPLFKHNIKKYLGHESFDLVLYSTPPITFIRTLKYLRSSSKDIYIYLMLKDIFPQNAVDIEMMKENSLIHRFFKRKEKILYNLVDKVGVMSPANKDYFIKHNPEHENIVEILPNAIKLRDISLNYTREDFGISSDKVVFVYGGNLGYPQAIEFLVECAKSIEDLENVEFVVAGTGSKQNIIEEYIERNNPKNFKYLGQLPKDKYDELVFNCDVGLIFLDYRFTIPNYPQRLLSYMQAKLPIVSVSDIATDIGSIAEENHYGFHVDSTDTEAFRDVILKLSTDKKLIEQMGNKAYSYLVEQYTVESAYEIIKGNFK